MKFDIYFLGSYKKFSLVSSIGRTELKCGGGAGAGGGKTIEMWWWWGGGETLEIRRMRRENIKIVKLWRRK